MSATPAFDLLLFGGTGDLAMRKLIPALWQAAAASQLHADGRIVALGRKPFDAAGYRVWLSEHARPLIGTPVDDASWNAFLARVDYLPLDACRPEDFALLAAKLPAVEKRVLVAYLATSPELFAPICESLAAVGLDHENARVVLEKPLGHDLASANAINDAVLAHFREGQVYRIDHYLGKESVQNLMAIRFGNVLFEPLWRREWVEHVEITIAEDLGVEGRGEFYNQTGALRDMVQNHLLQLLCIVAMEPPASMGADAIRDEKLKVVTSLRRFRARDVETKTVRGQYAAGSVHGAPVPAYREEAHVADDSRTETYVALKAEIDNWRWADVPFYLRTGKRLAERVAEIVIHFRDVPHALLPTAPGGIAANRLVIHLQPEENIRLHVLAKAPGDSMELQSAALELDFTKRFAARRADAYERLLLDAIRGNLALFMRRDEGVEAWRWVEPILEAWEADPAPPAPYPAGSWGPAAASRLLYENRHAWHEECAGR
ncbi:glucose-6-phosphate dehydrogenase [Crenobacter cavernae]|uniref:Glucose-6-phosphate 1-dehydrogenase n=1 Tax=Crenobacter cavernae TaxID=2290923 RepID=A0ABY0FHN9_9NEIS|nr:glucose-6-phosphate dehydrogenase [Crenobacter cavernae]RXZ44406.1 glucose-6-phosphate dehydrogenase [Crenobacter cavernae]